MNRACLEISSRRPEAYFGCHSVSCFGLAPIWLGREEVRLNKPAQGAFNAQDFLAMVGVGKTFLRLEKNQNVFVQGDVADTVYYIQKGQDQIHGHIQA